MTTYIIISSIISFLTISFCAYLFYWHKTNHQKRDKKKGKKKQNKNSNLDWKIYFLLILSLILVVLAFIAPLIFTRLSINNDFDFTQTGPIGDTIGGLMNPFIALAGVIVTGLAFYIQYKANQQQRELFEKEQKESKSQLQKQIDNQNHQNKIQQFESQFYEMLRLHRDNITEMKINGYDFEETDNSLKKFEKTTEGRKLFVVMKTEFECILNLYAKDNKLDKLGFQKCYELFFSGLDVYAKSYPTETVFIELLKKARRNHENPLKQKITTNKDRKEFISKVELYFNYKPFSGHSQRLGHYFRHLYLTVKSIVNCEIVTEYDEQMKYLRILRAQLSNHEQILLFYNWLSEYGNDWENDKHSFFTEYCKIHNLGHKSLFDDKYISDNVNYLRTKKVELRTGKMFEIA